MSDRNWEFEIAVLVFAGFFVVALVLLGSDAKAASDLFHLTGLS